MENNPTRQFLGITLFSCSLYIELYTSTQKRQEKGYMDIQLYERKIVQYKFALYIFQQSLHTGDFLFSVPEDHAEK